MVIFRDKKFYLIGFSYLLISFSILILCIPDRLRYRELKIPYQSAAGLVAVIGVAGAIGNWSWAISRILPEGLR
jgi:hypothetical protein